MVTGSSLVVDYGGCFDASRVRMTAYSESVTE